MNKWFSRENKFMLDLDQVTSFEFFDRSLIDSKGFDSSYGPINEVKQFKYYILIFAGGREYSFRGEEALELYNKLSSARQVL